jgi:hypothetical protein
MTAEATKVTLTVENPKHNTRYYVVAQPIFTPPVFPVGRSFLDDDETVDSDDTRTSTELSFNIPMTVPAKQVRNTQPHCTYRSCGKFCKRGAKFCCSCEVKATQERIAMERFNRNK